MAGAETGTELASKFLTYDGPRQGVSYPLKLVYCGECTMPLEYCEYYPNYDQCKGWLEKHLPKEFEKLLKDKGGSGDDKEGGEGGSGSLEDADDKKKRQTRGGKGMVKIKKKSEPQGVRMATATRGKRKKVTFVMGLATYDIDLKESSKFFSSKFSCGSSVTGEDEIVIQGDVKDELWDVIPEKWPIIDEDSIEDMGDIKKG